MTRILDDSILNSYNDSIKIYNGVAKETLGMFNRNRANGELTGSNPFMLVHLANSELIPSRVKLATRKDLGISCDYDVFYSINCENSQEIFLEDNRFDFGLALRSVGDSYSPNDLLAKILGKQLKSRGMEIEKGKLISFAGLKIKEDKNSAYGLVFEFNDQVNKDDILDLNDFNWDYTREDGLSNAYFYGHWSSYSMHLGFSNHCCKVAVESTEDT